MSGIQKVYSIEESKGRDVESYCSDQNEKILAFFWFQKKAKVFSFWSEQHDSTSLPLLS